MPISGHQPTQQYYSGCCHPRLLQSNVTNLFEACCAVDSKVKQRVQDLAAVLQDHAKTDQASNMILKQDTKLLIVQLAS